MRADVIQIAEHRTSYGLSYLEIRGCKEFNPIHIFECGQCFRWNLLPESRGIYLGVAGNRVLAVSATDGTNGKVITLANTDLREFEVFWKNYFDFERDYTAILQSLSGKDEYLKEAVNFGNGIRILRQEPFETLISFILSSNNNIPRIKGCIEKLSAAYGEKIETGAAFRQYLYENSSLQCVPTFYAFPTAERLSGVSADALGICCKAGYRCAYIQKTVCAYLKSPINGMALRNVSLYEARKMLCAYTGVGPKVADCVLLFAGLRTDAFPVDVWVRRVLENLYFKRAVSPREAEKFVSAYFDDLAGFAQQYLFYGIRECGLEFFTDLAQQPLEVV